MLGKLGQWVRQLNNRYLPCYVLSWRPMVVFAYDTDFTKSSESFMRVFAGRGEVYLFLQLGWQHETPKVAEPFAEQLHELVRRMPSLHITILANSPTEVERLEALKLRTIFCHQNAFIDETRYKLALHAPKKYDAIYIARVSPFKRHALTANIRSLRLIGAHNPKEQKYVDDMLELLKYAAYKEKVSASRIPAEIASARCGLCLSAEEGAMFVSAEYLLCGIPVVNTPNIGGRDYLIPDFAVQTVEPTPEAVAAAVEVFCKNPPEPQKIRAATLEKMQTSRAVLRALLREILPDADTIRLPHKLALRCTRMPWVNFFHGLKRG